MFALISTMFWGIRDTDLRHRNTPSCTPSTRSRYVCAPRFSISVPKVLANSAQTRTQILGAIQQPRTIYNMKWAMGLWRGMSSVVVGAGQFLTIVARQRTYSDDMRFRTCTCDLLCDLRGRQALDGRQPGGAPPPPRRRYQRCMCHHCQRCPHEPL